MDWTRVGSGAAKVSSHPLPVTPGRGEVGGMRNEGSGKGPTRFGVSRSLNIQILLPPVSNSPSVDSHDLHDASLPPLSSLRPGRFVRSRVYSVSPLKGRVSR